MCGCWFRRCLDNEQCDNPRNDGQRTSRQAAAPRAWRAILISSFHAHFGVFSMAGPARADRKADLKMRPAFIIAVGVIVLLSIVSLFGLTSLNLPFINPTDSEQTILLFVLS